MRDRTFTGEGPASAESSLPVEGAELGRAEFSGAAAHQEQEKQYGNRNADSPQKDPTDSAAFIFE